MKSTIKSTLECRFERHFTLPRSEFLTNKVLTLTFSLFPSFLTERRSSRVCTKMTCPCVFQLEFLHNLISNFFRDDGVVENAMDVFGVFTSADDLKIEHLVELLTLAGYSFTISEKKDLSGIKKRTMIIIDKLHSYKIKIYYFTNALELQGAKDFFHEYCHKTFG